MSGRAAGPEAARVRALAARDRFAGRLGAELVEAAPGRVVLRLAVREAHLNFYGYCHGGVIFALADSAFGLASNAPGEVAVAIDAHVTYNTAVQAGAVLLATATELGRTRRTGTYRAEVRRADDDALVSHFTGTVYRTGRPAEEDAAGEAHVPQSAGEPPGTEPG